MRQHITAAHICLHEKSAEPECEDEEGGAKNCKTAGRENYSSKELGRIHKEF